MPPSRDPRSAPPRLILASTSVYRRQLLQRLGIEFEVAAPDFDEDQAQERLLSEGASLAQLAGELALGKAMAVARDHPGTLVLGGDQMATIGQRILGKPEDAQAALVQLQLLQGSTHELLSAVAIVDGRGAVTRHLDVTRLTMRSLSSAALVGYIERDQPFDCAGSYRIEDHGIALFERIETQDATAIQGLPLLAVSRMLRELGFSFPP